MKKAIAMKCSQKDWGSIKGRLEGINQSIWGGFEHNNYLTNNWGEKLEIGNHSMTHECYNRCEKYETFNAKIFLNACGIDCDVYEITKEQVLEIYKGYVTRTKIEQWFPDAFKKELIIRKWYKNLDKGYEKSICCVIEVNKEDKDCFSGYGIDYIGEYFYEPIDTTFCGSNNWQEATTQEVEAALICEAKKRGVWNNKNIICLFVNGKNVSENLDVSFYKNQLWGKHGLVFDNGKWATIIEPEKMTLEQIEKELGRKIQIV